MAADVEHDDTTVYKVVVNHEEQYSIWPEDRPNPAGWSDAGKQGSKAECLEHIRAVWTDMRPLSLRQRMAAAADAPPAPAPAAVVEGPSLVERLSQGQHPVEFRCRPETSLAALRDRLQQGLVHVRFTDTRGGTELGVRIDRDACDFKRGDLEAGTGAVDLVGNLTLDYVPVRFVATLDLQTLKGTGCLQPVSQ